MSSLTSPEVQALREDVKDLSKNIGQHVGQLYQAFEQLAKALEATDARVTELENKGKSRIREDITGREL